MKRGHVKAMKYSEPQPIGRDDVLNALASEDANTAAEAIIRMSCSELDVEWAEHICLIALGDQRKRVKTAALTAVGSLARRFRTLNLDLILPVIHGLLVDQDLQGIAEDALDDIAVFASKGRRD